MNEHMVTLPRRELEELERKAAMLDKMQLASRATNSPALVVQMRIDHLLEQYKEAWKRHGTDVNNISAISLLDVHGVQVGWYIKAP